MTGKPDKAAVIVLERHQLVRRKTECLQELACLRSHRTEDEIERELDEIRFLLREETE